MGYVLHLILALASLAAVDLGFALDSHLGLVVPALVVVPVVLGRLAKEWVLRGRFRSAARCERLLSISPVLLQGVAVLLLGWRAFVEESLGVDLGLAGWPGPELFLGVAPYALFQLVVIDAQARLQDPREDEIARLRGFQLRMFLSSFLPLVAFVALSSAIRASEVVRVYVEEVDLVNGLLSALLLWALVWSLPAILRRAWDTAPLEPGVSRELLEAVARAGRFRCKELVVWRTANQMANAAIIGFTSGSRIVVFTDALLAQLRPRELAAVFAHEMGHARRHHAAVFGAYALAVFLGLDLILREVELESDWMIAAAAGAILALWYVSFGYLSRRFELEADLESVEVLGDAGALIDALHAVVGVHARKRTTWRHFSTDERAAFLERIATDPAPARALRRRLRWWRAVIYVAFAVTLALQLRLMLTSWDDDRAWAGLRLGDYEAARRAAEGTADEELAALVERAGRIPAEERDGAELLSRARATLAAGRLESAQALLHLGLLRELDEDGLAVLRFLEDPEGDFPAVDPAWRRAWAAGAARRGQ